jgi:transposase
MEVGVTFAHALPNTTSLHLDAWYFDEAHAQITLLISSTQAEPRCPGCHGFRGQYGIVALDVRRMRQAQGLAPRQRRSDQPLPVVTAAPHRRLTPRQATWLVLRPAERSTAQDHHQLAQLTTQTPELAEAVALAQDFAALVRQRQPTQLDPWLTRAATSALAPFRRLAKGLRADDAAVKAGVTLPWSQGLIEGQINRLKLLKRQMFGQATLARLARRFLLAA